MLIAHYPADAARRVDLPATFPADERLRALAARRRQRVDARQAEGRRADLASEPIVRESLATVVAALTQSLDAIEEAIERHIASDGELDRLAKALRGVRGVGSRRGRDAGRRPAGVRPPDGKQIAALVGLAPHTHESEKKSRQAKTGHGRPLVAQRLVQRRPGRHSLSF